MTACWLAVAASTAHASTQVGTVQNYSATPTSIARVPGTRKAYVSSQSAASGQQIAIVDTQTKTVTGYVSGYPDYLPGFIGVSHDGRIAAALDYPKSQVYIIDTGKDAVIGPVTFDTPPDYDNSYFTSVAFSRDGKTAYTTSRVFAEDPGVTVIDVASRKQHGAIPVTGVFIATSPTQDKAYVVTRGKVDIIDTIGNTVTGSVAGLQTTISGFSPQVLAFSDDGATAYIGGINGDSRMSIAVVDATHDRAIGSIPVDAWWGCKLGDIGVYSIAFAPDGKTAFAEFDNSRCANMGTLVIDTATRTAKGTIPGLPNGGWLRSWSTGQSTLATSPDGRHLYVGIVGQFNSDPDDVAVADLDPATPQGISPSSGTTSGGQVRISGANLAGTTAVYFGGPAYEGTGLMFVSDSAFIVTAPPHPVGVVDVTLVNLGGNATMPRAFTYVTSPAP
uniref:IPT/TIG domain-containing protein n=1 Tax=Bordetella sputigena TaxID=1416810 RepID=UPI0039F0B90F